MSSIEYLSDGFLGAEIAQLRLDVVALREENAKLRRELVDLHTKQSIADNFGALKKLAEK